MFYGAVYHISGWFLLFNITYCSPSLMTDVRLLRKSMLGAVLRFAVLRFKHFCFTIIINDTQTLNIGHYLSEYF